MALPASLVGGMEVGGRGRGAVGAFKAAMSGLSSGGGLCNGCWVGIGGRSADGGASLVGLWPLEVEEAGAGGGEGVTGGG